MPIWKASSLQKEEGLWIRFSRLHQPLLGKTHNHCSGTAGCSALSNASSWANFPSQQHSNHPRVTNSTVRIWRRKPRRCFTTWQILCCSDTSTHPSLPVSISFQAHLFLPALAHLEEGQVSLVKVAFSKRGKQSSLNGHMFADTLNTNTSTTKKAASAFFSWQNHGPSYKGLGSLVFIQHQQISRRHMLHTPEVACMPNSFLLWLCSRRNIFHFLRNKCYDSHMDWIKSTKTRLLSQRPHLFIKKIKNTCPVEIQSG